MSKTFRVAPYDGAAIFTTLVFLFALLFFGVRVALAVTNGVPPDNFDLAVTVLLALLIAYAWVRSVRRYTLGEGQVTVERAGPGRVHIPLERIESIDPKPDLVSFVRVGFLSTEGLFGWAGRAQIRKQNEWRPADAQVYGTNARKAVVLQLNTGRTMVLTPADPEAFLAALHEAGIGRTPTPASQSKQQKGSKNKKKTARKT